MSNKQYVAYISLFYHLQIAIHYCNQNEKKFFIIYKLQHTTVIMNSDYELVPDEYEFEPDEYELDELENQDGNQDGDQNREEQDGEEQDSEEQDSEEQDDEETTNIY